MALRLETRYAFSTPDKLVYGCKNVSLMITASRCSWTIDS
jgi:hypothetical protein